MADLQQAPRLIHKGKKFIEKILNLIQELEWSDNNEE